MKSIILGVAAIFILMFSQCEKSEFIAEDEIPQWLSKRIADDETQIENSETGDMINFGAWLRYKYKREYYFEYHNPFMSVCCFMYDFNGNYLSSVDFEDYSEKKCCERFVWKAPKYDEFNL